MNLRRILKSPSGREIGDTLAVLTFGWLHFFPKGWGTGPEVPAPPARTYDPSKVTVTYGNQIPLTFLASTFPSLAGGSGPR